MEGSMERSRKVLVVEITSDRCQYSYFSQKRDTEPRPIRGFLRNPDFREGRDPLTGREGNNFIYSSIRHYCND